MWSIKVYLTLLEAAVVVVVDDVVLVAVVAQLMVADSIISSCVK